MASVTGTKLASSSLEALAIGMAVASAMTSVAARGEEVIGKSLGA